MYKKLAIIHMDLLKKVRMIHKNNIYFALNYRNLIVNEFII